MPYANPEEYKLKQVWKNYYWRNFAKQKARRRALKMEILQAYGGFCVCCGEVEPAFLSIDHINNDGAEHRKEVSKQTGLPFYQWLKTNGFPKENFQILCHNCNRGKFFNGGTCPHEQTLLKEKIMRANPLGDLEYEHVNGGEGDTNDMNSSTHRAGVSVKGDIHPSPAPTPRHEIEQKRGHFGGGKDTTGVAHEGQF